MERQPRSRRTQGARASHPDWALGCADDVWWSRLAQPDLHRWTAPNGQLRLLEKARVPHDPDPTALAWYGLLLRAVDSRRGLPDSSRTPVPVPAVRGVGWRTRSTRAGVHQRVLGRAIRPWRVRGCGVFPAGGQPFTQPSHPSAILRDRNHEVYIVI